MNNYDEKKSQGSNFQVHFSLGRRQIFDFDFYFHHKFLLIDLNFFKMIILDIYASKSFQ
jgi:hypothetical protein